MDAEEEAAAVPAAGGEAEEGDGEGERRGGGDGGEEPLREDPGTHTPGSVTSDHQGPTEYKGSQPCEAAEASCGPRVVSQGTSNTIQDGEGRHLVTCQGRDLFTRYFEGGSRA